MKTLFDDLETKEHKDFIKYHNENPHIYNMFRHYALEAIKKGHKRLSAEFIICILRWETGARAYNDSYKINNNVKPFYSRMFLREFPNYKSFFEIRKSKADEIFTRTMG